MKKDLARGEYPRPQLVRQDWISLNGEWDFTKDMSTSGITRKLFEKEICDEKILVPFCPESDLSNIGFKDFMPAVWYSKKLEIPLDWKDDNTILHFGAVDYHAFVWVNGKKVGEHVGGYTPFSFDITPYLDNDNNFVTLCAMDNNRNGKQPSGKQSNIHCSYGCSYTRTTGIWQSVWMERVEDIYVTSLKTTADYFNQEVTFEIETNTQCNTFVKVEVEFAGKDMGTKTQKLVGNKVSCTISLDESHPWTVACGNLYDVSIRVYDENVIYDKIDSYFGLRSITWDQKGMKINDEYVYQRLVLDQGFYPEGIYTAPSDEALKYDIEMSMAMGFNGARLHEKIFEPRFLYWADKLGYLCWGEHGNWGLDITNFDSITHFLPEWIQALERDYSHPSIIGWCPFNETWDVGRGENEADKIPQNRDVLKYVYLVTKQIDKTRPVIDTSGNYHVVTDIFDIHDYTQDPETLKEHLKPNREGSAYITFEDRQKDAYKSQPYFVSEYGGIGWFVEQKTWGIYEKSWGYGKGPKTEAEFIERYKGLTLELLDNPGVCAFCYTQLYDVEQEQNGLYTYDRKAKFDPKIISAINKTIASIEK